MNKDIHYILLLTLEMGETNEVYILYLKKNSQPKPAVFCEKKIIFPQIVSVNEKRLRRIGGPPF